MMKLIGRVGSQAWAPAGPATAMTPSAPAPASAAMPLHLRCFVIRISSCHPTFDFSAVNLSRCVGGLRSARARAAQFCDCRPNQWPEQQCHAQRHARADEPIRPEDRQAALAAEHGLTEGLL